MAEATVQRSTRIGVAAVAILALVVVALAIYAYGLRAKKQTGLPEGAVAVTVTSSACEPNALTVPAGRVTFAVTNKSDRVLEWEILDGVMVVEERENIAPGFVQTLNARLEPGTYQITCGLLSNPRGTLTVTEAPGGATGPKAPELVQFVGPIAEYKVYAATESAALVAATGQLAATIKAGDLAGAEAAYGPAHAGYEHLKPVTELFGDLDAAIDARPDYFEEREKDPAFGGFRRIAYGLFKDKSLDGLAPVADKLVSDVAKITAQVKAATVPPDKMVRGAANLVRSGATPDGSGDGAALGDFAASVEGAGKVVTLLQPLSRKADKGLSDRIDAAFTEINEKLAKYRGPDGRFASGAGPDRSETEALMKLSVALADDIGKLNAALGLE
jgi:iron uptake system component EfeO